MSDVETEVDSLLQLDRVLAEDETYQAGFWVSGQRLWLKQHNFLLIRTGL